MIRVAYASMGGSREIGTCCLQMSNELCLATEYVIYNTAHHSNLFEVMVKIIVQFALGITFVVHHHEPVYKTV